MSDPTTIPASREEIAARIRVCGNMFLQDSESAVRRLIMGYKADLGSGTGKDDRDLTRADLVQTWLSVAREQGRSEGAKAPIDARLEPDRFAQVAYLPDGTKISICRSPQGGAWIEHGPQARIGISDGPAEARKAQGREGT